MSYCKQGWANSKRKKNRVYFFLGKPSSIPYAKAFGKYSRLVNDKAFFCINFKYKTRK